MYVAAFASTALNVGVSWDNEGLFDAPIDLIAYVFRYFLCFPAMDLYVINIRIMVRKIRSKTGSAKRFKINI